MRAADLLYLLVANYGNLDFTTEDASRTVIEYQMRNPNAYLVDNPKGLLSKWVSNDLKRLHAMKLLDRKREKRPKSEIPSSYRGFQYRYWANNTGLGYYSHLLKSGFGIPEKPASYSEADIYADTASAPEFEKPALRQQKRIGLRWVEPPDPRLSYWQKLVVLEEGDRKFRRRVGLFRRYHQGSMITNLTNQVDSLTREKKMLETSLALMTARYEKCRSELKFYKV